MTTDTMTNQIANMSASEASVTSLEGRRFQRL
jgi:hypothetical protein